MNERVPYLYRWFLKYSTTCLGKEDHGLLGSAGFLKVAELFVSQQTLLRILPVFPHKSTPQMNLEDNRNVNFLQVAYLPEISKITIQHSTNS